jgi:hypothetical protein
VRTDIIVQARVTDIMPVVPGEVVTVDSAGPFNLAHQGLHLVGEVIDLDCLNQETGGHW